jgi:hypothetical protein
MRKVKIENVPKTRQRVKQRYKILTENKIDRDLRISEISDYKELLIQNELVYGRLGDNSLVEITAADLANIYTALTKLETEKGERDKTRGDAFEERLEEILLDTDSGPE